VKPLEDVRVLAVEQYGAGPYGSLHLAQLGADVIKIEDARTGGDVGRYVPPFQEGEDSLFFETFNRGKRSLSLDLSAPAGREVFEDLVRVSDVVYSNLRGDVPERMKLRYSDLAPLNVRIVCCCLSGFGMTGPRRSEGAYDHVIQALAGWMALTGEPGGPPTKSGLSVVDYSAGLVAAMAVLAGLHAARRDGTGCDCDVSLFETAISMLSYPATWLLTGDLPAERTHHSAHPSLVPFQAFEASDGWIVIACPKEKFWAPLCGALGLEGWATDSRFASFAGRRAHREELLAGLAERLRAAKVLEWVERLGAVGVPCAPVNEVDAALADPQTEQRGLVVETDHPLFGKVRQVASPVRVGDRALDSRRAPRRHEHADEILGDLLGYGEDRRLQLESAGAFGRDE
jgi:crotonobetainyl-CoA:carnitine CoA-transferase CaiB-like acyl-CoA transferase